MSFGVNKLSLSFIFFIISAAGARARSARAAERAKRAQRPCEHNVYMVFLISCPFVCPFVCPRHNSATGEPIVSSHTSIESL